MIQHVLEESVCHCHPPSCLTRLGGIDDEIITERGQPPLLGDVIRLHGFIVCLNTTVSFLCLLKNKNTKYSTTPHTPEALNQSPNKLVSPQRQHPQELQKLDVGPTGRLASHGRWPSPWKPHTSLSDVRLPGLSHAMRGLDPPAA